MGCALPDIKTASGDRYDALDHLTTADYPTNVENQGIMDESFAYDKVGNRENPGDPAIYEYNQNHQITKSPNAATYSFDNDGNMTSKAGGFTYGYNKNNRLTSFTDANDSTNNATYQYDPFGRRISKTVNGVKTWFLWEGDVILAEYNQVGVREKRYAYLPDGMTPIQVEDTNGIYNAHFDHLQTPMLLTNSSQSVVWSKVQEAFGSAVISGSVEFNFRFPGHYADSESGLHYNYYRYYDPSLGRYPSADPLGVWKRFDDPQMRLAATIIPIMVRSGGINHLYTYVDSNPLIFIDPFGLVKCSCRATNSGGIGYKNGVKQCRYTCEAEDGTEFSVDGDGVDATHGDYCQGANIETVFTQSLDWSNNTTSLDDFDVDTDDYWFFQSDFQKAVEDAYNSSKQ